MLRQACAAKRGRRETTIAYDENQPSTADDGASAALFLEVAAKAGSKNAAHLQADVLAGARQFWHGLPASLRTLVRAYLVHGDPGSVADALQISRRQLYRRRLALRCHLDHRDQAPEVTRALLKMVADHTGQEPGIKSAVS